MVRAVFFDVDGVLVHPWRFRDHLSSRHGITPEATAGFFRGPFVDCVLGRAELGGVLPPYLLSWGWEGSLSNFLLTWLSIENAPDEAVLTLVRELRERRVPCYVASTQERLRAAYLANEMGLADRFEGLFFSCDLSAKKPERQFFQSVRERVRLPAESLLLIDDSVGNVEGARAAGWQAEHFQDATTLRACLAHYRLL